MQSSGLTALRSGVMLVCLIALPLAAVVGTSLPKALNRVLRGQMPAEAAEEPAETDPRPRIGAAESLLADDRSEEDSIVKTPKPAPAAEGYANQSVAAAGVPRARITGVRPVGAVPKATITAVRAAPASPSPLWAPAERSARSPRPRNSTAHNVASINATKKSTASQPPLRRTIYTAPIDEANSSARVSAPDRLAHASFLAGQGERRLEELGAVGVRVEPWGTGRGVYRCDCQVPIPGHNHAWRHFQATARGRDAAVACVAAQVEAWQAALKPLADRD